MASSRLLSTSGGDTIDVRGRTTATPSVHVRLTSLLLQALTTTSEVINNVTGLANASATQEWQPDHLLLNSTSATILDTVLEEASISSTLSSSSSSLAMDCFLTYRSYDTALEWRLEHRWAWLLHTYGLACLFFMLAFYAFFSILNLRAQLSARPYMSSINVFLCLLGSSRAICFLVDPSDYKGLMPETIGWILFELAFPCLISAFGLIQLAFMQLTQLHLGPAQLRSKSCISLVITTHFCFTFAINIMLSFNRPDFTVFCFISQTVFVLWGTGLCLTFLFGGYRMMRLLKRAPASMFQRSDSSGFENKVLALGMLANCHNLAAMTVAAAAAAPSFLAAPKIRITDENEQTYSYVSDNSQLSSCQNIHTTGNDVADGAPEDDECGPPINGTTSPGRRAAGGGGAIYTVSEDAATCDDEDDSGDQAMENTRMLPLAPGHDAGAAAACSGGVASRTNGRAPPHPPPTRQILAGKTGSRQVTSPPTQAQQNRRSPNNKRGSSSCNGGRSPKATPAANGSAKTLGDSVELSNLLPRGAARGGRFTPSQGIGRELKQDLTLVSILNHIAYVNQSVDDMSVVRRMQASCKSQVERVLYGTYASSAMGLVLCMLEVGRLYGPVIPLVTHLPAWTWFMFVSVHRLVEFAMGCAMANITKQPVNRHQYPAYHPCHMKHRANGLYF